MTTPTVPFSDLSKHSKEVAETLNRVHRVHIRRRDGEDLYLTTARHDREREETASVVAGLLAALVTSDEGVRAVKQALLAVFSWARHLSPEERQEFVRDLIDATRDAVDLDVHATLHRVVVEWRATARILADPALAARLTGPLPEDDHGEVLAP
ncbi:prevent-host-death family protein [Nonomuraea phyllanthi]|uniref:prevent-host-death family protein n=1 Tax=Nonomuraea phyllanthi TaxID=2219224 RepID=UPI0012931224|nr:prevent-host-death family protein [Nonomuraea phyllanthi]QFY06726.1 prevent-host-death family protein [Nonomuraea phyllanthi]